MNEIIKGNVHSIESFGTVDGPGIRFVVFMQGCPMRCLYCHNPDTWNFSDNKKLSSDEILEKYNSVKEFLKNGGITVSGGEPLAQINFIIDLFKKAKSNEIHTAIDTSGILFDKNKTEKFDELIKYTDLVLLDIKHINDEEHKKLTSFSNKNILNFAFYLSEKNIPVWIRYVLVPSINDKEEYLNELGVFLSKLNNVKMLDLLPYHDMAISKYQNLGMDYPLKHIKVPQKEDVLRAKKIIVSAYIKTKRKGN